MDAGESPGPRALATWERVEGVLGVTSEVTAIRITARRRPSGRRWSAARRMPPAAPMAASRYGRWMGRPPQEAKAERDFAEADRIRDRLKAAGWEVRDGRDGSVEVVRIAVACKFQPPLTHRKLASII